MFRASISQTCIYASGSIDKLPRWWAQHSWYPQQCLWISRFHDCRGLKDMQSAKLILVYIPIPTAKSVHVLKDMILAYASNAIKSFIRARVDEPHMLTDEDTILQQFNQFVSDPTITAAHYRPFQSPDNQMDRHNAVKLRKCFGYQLARKCIRTQRIFCISLHSFWHDKAMWKHQGQEPCLN